jgi:putative oxidoreductase
MKKPNAYLIAGGVMSALISLLHVVLAMKPDLYRYIGLEGASMTQMAEQGSGIIIVVTIVLALIFGIWALYAFSGAGLIRRLPLLRTGLVVIFTIYILRALVLPTEINMVKIQGYPFRFVVFSAISLVAGLLYLIGFLKQRKTLAPGKGS